MGSNTDYLNDLESFLDNPTGLISTSPNPVMSPMSNPINNGAGVRDRLRHHLGAEKRKLEDVSDVSVKTQRTDEHHHMMLDGLDHDPYKTEELKQEVEVKEEQPQSGFGQGGLLAQALMDKRPSSTNGHLNPQTGFFGVSSPRSVGSPAVPAAPSIPDVMALRQQIQDIKSNRNLTNEQKNAKLTELVGQHPSLHRRLMMASKINNEKMMRRNLGQEQLMQREQIPGTNMVQDFGPGYPSNNNENAFHTGPYMDNGMQNFGGPIPPGPRSRGGRAPIPPANMNGMYQGPIQNEMWEVGGKCMPNQIAPHIQPPPQYPYRQPGPRPSNMMNHMTPCYNSPQSEYMATGMYGQQQQMYSNQRGGAGVMGEPLYPNETCGPGPIGTRGFNPSMYGSGGMTISRMSTWSPMAGEMCGILISCITNNSSNSRNNNNIVQSIHRTQWGSALNSTCSINVVLLPDLACPFHHDFQVTSARSAQSCHRQCTAQHQYTCRWELRPANKACLTTALGLAHPIPTEMHLICKQIPPVTVSTSMKSS